MYQRKTAMKNDENCIDSKAKKREPKRQNIKIPAIPVVIETGGNYSLFLYRGQNTSPRKVEFNVPDRAKGQKWSITPDTLKTLSQTLEMFFRDIRISSTVFITEKDPPECLEKLESAPSLFKRIIGDSDENNEAFFFGIDRRSLIVKYYHENILFENGLFIEASKDRCEAFFCDKHKVISTVSFDAVTIGDNIDFPFTNKVLEILTTSRELICDAEKISPDAIFILTPSPSKADIHKIQTELNGTSFENKIFFCDTENLNLPVYAVKKLLSAANSLCR